MKLLDIENKLIQTIRNSREKMMEKFILGDLEKEYLDTIQKIYFDY